MTQTLTQQLNDEQLLEQQRSSPCETLRLRKLVLCPRASLLESLPPLHGPLGALCEGLRVAFAQERALLPAGAELDIHMPHEAFTRLDGTVRALMHAYVSAFVPGQAYDWQQEFFSSLQQSFNRFHYIRHLIDASDDFELILICWGKGQVSRVHNHAQSHCWLTCLLGEVVEKQYLRVGDDLPKASSPHGTSAQPLPGVVLSMVPCPMLKLSNTGTLKVGQTGYINDNSCLHSVACGPEVPEPGAVTLHLYSPPVRRVQLYEPDEHRVLTRVPGFFTVRGRPT